VNYVGYNKYKKKLKGGRRNKKEKQEKTCLYYQVEYVNPL